MSELPECYIKDGENVQILVSSLGFKNDEIKIIEEKTGGKFITKEEYEEYIKLKEEKSISEVEEEFDDTSLILRVDPDSAKLIVEEVKPDISLKPDYRDQFSNISIEEDESFLEKTSQTIFKEEISKKLLKDIGRWGEKYVYRYLLKTYNDRFNVKINWLNEIRETGKGYDFSIESNGNQIEYIEVKTKIDESPQFFDITGTQWELARKLYNENNGDKYKVYIVKNAGTENAKIEILENPTKLWKDGKLYAHPVRFRL